MPPESLYSGAPLQGSRARQPLRAPLLTIGATPHTVEDTWVCVGGGSEGGFAGIDASRDVTTRALEATQSHREVV